MKLTDEQREILAVCVLCQMPLDTDTVGDALESERTRPSQLFCERCGPASTDREHIYKQMVALGSLKASELAAARAEQAGITEEVARVTREEYMRASNEQN